MRQFGLGVACVMVALGMLAAGPAASAVTVIDGGSVLTDFQVVGRWQATDATSGGTRNTGGLTYVPEGAGALYAYGRGGTGTYALRKFDFPTAGPGLRTCNLLGSRPSPGGALTYDPDYSGGTVLSHGTYLSTGSGANGGADSNIITVDTGDVVLNDPTQTGAWYYYNSDMDRIPATWSLTGRNAEVVVRNGNCPFNALVLLEPDTTPDPDQYRIPQLPGRGAADDDKSVLMNVTAQLGMNSATGVQFVKYTKAVKPVLYLLDIGGSDTYHLFAVTAGPDGVFGESTPGVCDDVVTGYTFGEPGQGNTYQLQRQHITWENAPGNTTLVDIDGSYNTGFQSMAYDPSTGYLCTAAAITAQASS